MLLGDRGTSVRATGPRLFPDRQVREMMKSSDNLYLLSVLGAIVGSGVVESVVASTTSKRDDMIGYEMLVNVRSPADISQLNLPHRTNN